MILPIPRLIRIVVDRATRKTAGEVHIHVHNANIEDVAEEQKKIVPASDGSTSDETPTPHRETGRGGGRRGRGGRRGGPNRPSVAVHRHQARITALQIIYEVDVTDHGLEEVLRRTLDDPDEVVTPEVRTYAERLVHGTSEHQDRIDEYIEEAAPAFPVAQLASVDRNVLRLAIYELLHQPDVPMKAAINEAIELAKRYGGLNSSRFVNGVLGTVHARMERERASPGDSGEAVESDEESATGE